MMMKKENFSPVAAVLWSTIPVAARERILKNVFCVQCRGSVEISDVHGKERNGNLILTGQCAKCGQEVARVVETAEISSENN